MSHWNNKGKPCYVTPEDYLKLAELPCSLIMNFNHLALFFFGFPLFGISGFGQHPSLHSISCS